MEKIVLSAALLILISLASASRLERKHTHDEWDRQSRCRSGWIWFKKSCYKIIQRWKSWSESRDLCKHLDNTSYLVNIGSKKEDDFVMSMSKNSGLSFWTGLNDIRNEGRLVWDDTQQVPTYTNWGPTEPKHCVMLDYYSGERRWIDAGCDARHYALCEFQNHR